MDRVKQHRRIIKKIILEFTETFDESDEVENVILFDENHDSYMMQRVGWNGFSRIDRRYIFVRLRNGKIYVDDDWTQDGIAPVLVKAGVSPSEIVLAFNPPDVRELTGFAVA